MVVLTAHHCAGGYDGRVVLHSLQGNLVSSVPHLTAAQHGDKEGLLLYCALLLYRW